MWPARLRSLDATSPHATENLARDIALLDETDVDAARAALCVWESSSYVVVAGRSNVVEQEVDLSACVADGVPVLRRASGGGAVVIGPGCLCFSLALPIPHATSSLGISGVTRAVMRRLAQGLSTAGVPVAVQGVSDLVIGDLKFCGNAQRWRRRAFLHHGTILYDFDLARISRYLREPARQPEYRRGRSHHEFVTNLNRSRAELIDRLRETWNAFD
jgi:lipoate-protein ligase A